MSIVSIQDFYPDGNVRTDPQHLSDRQKEQARRNIGAMSASDATIAASVIPVSETGKSIRTDIVSPLASELNCRIRSKNILPFPYHDHSGSNHGITWTVNENGSVRAKGRATDSSVFHLYKTAFQIPEGSWVLSGCPKHAGLSVQLLVNSEYPTDNGNGVIVKPGLSYYAALCIRPEAGEVDVTFSPQLESGSTSTEFHRSVSSLDSVTVTQNPGGTAFHPSSDGTVTGMKSISPSMTIHTDNPGVVIEAKYYADTKGYIDREIRKIQNAIIGTV